MEIQKPKGLGLNSLVRKKYKEWQTMGLPKAGEQYKNTNVDQITMVAAKDEILEYLGWVRSDREDGTRGRFHSSSSGDRKSESQSRT